MEKDEREPLDNLIREQVIHILGTPFDLRTVQVRNVGAGRKIATERKKASSCEKSVRCRLTTQYTFTSHALGGGPQQSQ